MQQSGSKRNSLERKLIKSSAVFTHVRKVLSGGKKESEKMQLLAMKPEFRLWKKKERKMSLLLMLFLLCKVMR